MKTFLSVLLLITLLVIPAALLVFVCVWWVNGVVLGFAIANLIITWRLWAALFSATKES